MTREKFRHLIDRAYLKKKNAMLIGSYYSQSDGSNEAETDGAYEKFRF
jgi:hypothetical protein